MRTLGRTLLILSLMSMAASLAAAPIGYSINSDSQTSNADSLYRIDLASGAETPIATVKSKGQTRIDIEGLAFAPDGTLYAVDDDSLTLFPINPVNAAVDSTREVFIKNLPLGGSNDFGMTFACDGSLFVTSVARQSLYRLDLNGNVSVVGEGEGKLNAAKIIALAAWGDHLYGLGNGAKENGDPDTPNLYEIDLASGGAVIVGKLDGAGPYLQGGMSFDDEGNLWAITEGAQFDWPSQVMQVDTSSGKVSERKTLAENGFESLAIAAPGGCQGGSFVDAPDNTRRVPVLGPFGLAVAALLLLLTGLLAARRF